MLLLSGGLRKDIMIPKTHLQYTISLKWHGLTAPKLDVHTMFVTEKTILHATTSQGKQKDFAIVCKMMNLSCFAGKFLILGKRHNALV